MTRNKTIRVNESDLRLLKTAQDELEANVPLGYVARLGAKKLIDNEHEVHF